LLLLFAVENSALLIQSAWSWSSLSTEACDAVDPVSWLCVLQFFLVFNTLSTICNSIPVLPYECIRQYTQICTDFASIIQCPFVSLTHFFPNYRDPNRWEIQTGLADFLYFLYLLLESIWRNFHTAKNCSSYKIFQLWCLLTQCSSLVRENTCI
jgi:hypothetical protein